MAKRKTTSKGYKSKGQRPNVRKDIRKMGRREYVGSINQIEINSALLNPESV